MSNKSYFERENLEYLPLLYIRLVCIPKVHNMMEKRQDDILLQIHHIPNQTEDSIFRMKMLLIEK
jgi:hypothetical protein